MDTKLSLLIRLQDRHQGVHCWRKCLIDEKFAKNTTCLQRGSWHGRWRTRLRHYWTFDTRAHTWQHAWKPLQLFVPGPLIGFHNFRRLLSQKQTWNSRAICFSIACCSFTVLEKEDVCSNVRNRFTVLDEIWFLSEIRSPSRKINIRVLAAVLLWRSKLSESVSKAVVDEKSFSSKKIQSILWQHPNWGLSLSCRVCPWLCLSDKESFFTEEFKMFKNVS